MLWSNRSQWYVHVICRVLGERADRVELTGGHLRPEVYFNMPTYIEKYGYEAAAEISKFEVTHLQVIRDLVNSDQIDCDLTLTRTFDVFLDDHYAKKSKEAYDRMLRSGITSIKDAHYTPEKQAEQVRDLFIITRIGNTVLIRNDLLRFVASKALEAASVSQLPISGPTSLSCIYLLVPLLGVPIFKPPPL